MRPSTNPLDTFDGRSPLPVLTTGIRRAASLAQTRVHERKDRPWCALVIVPLCVLLAVLTVQLWALVPLVVLMWWWGSTETPWVWILGILESCWGAQWVLIGTYLLGTFPNDRGAVAVFWIGYAVLVAGIGMVNRYRYAREFGL
jgi:hypothetical protein